MQAGKAQSQSNTIIWKNTVLHWNRHSPKTCKNQKSELRKRRRDCNTSCCFLLRNRSWSDWTKLELLFETQLFKIHTHDVHMTRSKCWVCSFCSNCVKLFWSGQGIIRQVATSFPDCELLEIIRKVGVTVMPLATVGQVRAMGCSAIFHY